MSSSSSLFLLWGDIMLPGNNIHQRQRWVHLNLVFNRVGVKEQNGKGQCLVEEQKKNSLASSRIELLTWTLCHVFHQLFFWGNLCLLKPPQRCTARHDQLKLVAFPTLPVLLSPCCAAGGVTNSNQIWKLHRETGVIMTICVQWEAYECVY